MAPIASGSFKAINGMIEVMSGNQWTVDMVRVFQAVLEETKAGKITPAEAVRKVKKIDRRFGLAVNLAMKFGVPMLSVLIAVSSIYIAHADSDSSSELSARMYAEMQKQTVVMQSLAPQPAPTPPKLRQQVKRPHGLARRSRQKMHR